MYFCEADQLIPMTQQETIDCSLVMNYALIKDDGQLRFSKKIRLLLIVS